MEILLIRHTQTAVAAGVCYGQSDVPLASTAAADISATLANIPACDVVHSSPASRCEVLARALAARDRCPLKFAPALLELNFGDWERQSWGAIPREQSDLWAEDTWVCSPPNGENERDLWARVSRWFDEDLQGGGGRQAVVAHGGSLRILRCLILGLEPEQRWARQISFGEVLPLRMDSTIG
jgi:alpha-ribazole phosphatase